MPELSSRNPHSRWYKPLPSARRKKRAERTAREDRVAIIESFVHDRTDAKWTGELFSLVPSLALMTDDDIRQLAEAIENKTSNMKSRI